MIRSDNGWTVWLTLDERRPAPGMWVWLWGPRLGQRCHLVTGDDLPSGVCLWASAKVPEPPASVRSFGMHVFAAELSGREVQPEVVAAISALGWDDEVAAHVAEMREVLL